MFSATTQGEPIYVSYLRHIIRPQDGSDPRLWQNKVTETDIYLSFEEFVADLWKVATYPKAQSSKLETYGFTPTIFQESAWKPRSKPDAEPQWGTWRAGEHSIHEVSLAYFDLDNHHDDEAWVEFETVEAVLREMGLSYALYTSYSHLKKEGRHKVRILVPTSRPMTYDEAFYVYVLFDQMLYGQLDGSIYDDGDYLYGPTHGGRTAQWLDGQALDVDAVLAYVADELPADAFENVQRERKAKVTREWTEGEVADYRRKVSDASVSAGVSISNPAICKPEWLLDLDRCANGGSHRQTLLMILSRIWAMSDRSLSFGEMCALQGELDWRWFGYCARTYGQAALQADVRSVMALRGTTAWKSEAELRQDRLAANIKRLSRKI